MSTALDAQALATHVRKRLIGRAAEIDQLVAALAAGCDVVLEGPGTSKSSLLRAVIEAAEVPSFVAEGSAFLTPARFVGRHDQAAVLAHGYRPEDFVPGPLVQAMQTGGLLILEEVNRVPADTLNSLLGPLAERAIHIPSVGTITAAPGFVFAAAMNPGDKAGTAELSRSIRDRLLRIPLGHQALGEERQIVAGKTRDAAGWLIDAAARIARATREHPDVARGASVRGAIDLALVASVLGSLRGTRLDHQSANTDALVLDAAYVSLSGRIELDPASTRTIESVIADVVWGVLLPAASIARGDRKLTVDNAFRTARRGAARADRPSNLARSPNRRPTRDAVWPRPARAGAPPRVYRVDELGTLFSARSAQAPPFGIQPALPGGGGLENPGEPSADTVDLAAAGDLAHAIASAADHRKRVDPLLRAEAKRIADRMVIRMARRIPSGRAGGGKLRSMRYRGDSDDLDLDRTLEEIAGKPHPEPEDVWVVERVRARRAYALLLDVSGSMRGEQLELAATAAAAVAVSVREDELAVVAFWRDAAVLKRVDQHRDVEALVTDILSIRARGLTNLRLGLETGLRELARSRTTDRVGILLSDGGHNVGADPLDIAPRLAPLHVIATSPSESRIQACRELAACGGGHAALVSSLDEVAGLVSSCLR